MSDSDENAFASADEGDENESRQTASGKHKVKAGETKDIPKASPSAPDKDAGKKGKKKQQQKNKKGKTSGQSPQAKDSPSVTEKPSPKADTEDKPLTDMTKKFEEMKECDENTTDKANEMKDPGGSAKQSEENVEVKEVEKTESPKAKLPISDSMKSPEAQTIPASERDHHTPQQEAVLHKLEESANSGSSGWGWSSWGSSLLSAASNSVQTFTHQVGDGLSTIMDTVESSLGVPDAKTLAEADKLPEPQTLDEPQNQTVTHEPEERKQTVPAESASSEEKQADKPEGKTQSQESSGGASAWFSSWGVGDLAKKMQDTTKSLAAKSQTLMTEGFDAVEHLAAGGIDVLESIGKKTYNTLAEHDPALRRTRQFLSSRSGSNKPNLSSTLREAREQAEKRQQQDEAAQEALKADFGTLFDDFQGIAHLEALEMLSNQSEKKVHSLLNSLSSEDLANIKPQLLNIKAAFELDEDADVPEDQDFSNLVQQYLSELALGTAPDKLNKVHQMVQAWIHDLDAENSAATNTTKETHEKSIQALAELTAKGVEQFHKAGELVLMDKDKDKNCVERAHSLARLTGVLCHEIGNLSNKFVACLNKLVEEDKSEDVTSMITNIYLEASNSSTYIQDAFLLLLPVLQHAALEQSILARTS